MAHDANDRDARLLFGGSADGTLYRWTFSVMDIDHHALYHDVEENGNEFDGDQQDEVTEDILPQYEEAEDFKNEAGAIGMTVHNGTESDALRVDVEVQSGHHNSINEMRVSQIGTTTYIITADASGSIRCWNAQNLSTWKEYVYLNTLCFIICV